MDERERKWLYGESVSDVAKRDNRESRYHEQAGAVAPVNQSRWQTRGQRHYRRNGDESADQGDRKRQVIKVRSDHGPSRGVLGSHEDYREIKSESARRRHSEETAAAPR